MSILVVLRVTVGAAVIALGVWLFAQALPALSFQVLVLCLSAGVLIIEAPRFLKMHRQRQERLARHIDKDASAEKMMDRANSFRRWIGICYVAAIALLFVGLKLFGPQGFMVTIGISLALVALGFALGTYRVFAQTTLDFRSLSATRPAYSQPRMWTITAGLFAVVILALVAEKVWHVPATNWLYGALGVCLVAVLIWRWLRGWPKQSDSE